MALVVQIVVDVGQDPHPFYDLVCQKLKHTAKWKYYGPLNLPRPLCGLIPPMATPLAAADRLDVAGVERLVSHILAGGVQGLFILGTTGEGPSLSRRMRRKVVETVGRRGPARCRRAVGSDDESAAGKR